MKRFRQNKSILFIIIVIIGIIFIFGIIYYISSKVGHTAQQKSILDNEFQNLSPALMRCRRVFDEEKRICDEELKECERKIKQGLNVQCGQSGQRCIKAIQNTENQCAEVFIERQRILNIVELG